MTVVTSLCFIATFSIETNTRSQSHYEQKYSVNHEEYFETNSAVHSSNTRNEHHLHRRNAIIELPTVYHIVSQVLRMKRHNIK